MAPRTADQLWQDFGLVQRAARYAAEAHWDQFRKGTAIPYLLHLWAVAALVLDHGGDDVQVAEADPRVQLTSACDKLHNARAIFPTIPRRAQRSGGGSTPRTRPTLRSAARSSSTGASSWTTCRPTNGPTGHRWHA